MVQAVLVGANVVALAQSQRGCSDLVVENPIVPCQADLEGFVVESPIVPRLVGCLDLAVESPLEVKAL